MKRALKRAESPGIYYFVNGERIDGKPDGLLGDVSGLRGDVTGLRGNVSGLSGDVDKCGLTGTERASGAVDIGNLVVDDADLAAVDTATSKATGGAS